LLQIPFAHDLAVLHPCVKTYQVLKPIAKQLVSS